ncbi:hypothetical protein [Arthrobacter sp. NicSoilC12]|uniref:hypothetical protein n=1 Tax=Arthrobacter sp. NicSoilC12 TaxID=2831001 RepID=UPI001CC79C01|nr:hypothetical protein [Arthrobacter sp. NicSoilC12]GIU56404.1 hypothetical protein NicSoilC12_21530 [Arthrobacter sp. NicSoilC12]
MTRASFRLFRTGLIGSTIVALAAGGHLAGGGRLPEPAIVTALCAVAMVPGAVLTRFRLSFPALAGLLGVGQLWLHWSFGTLSSGAPAALQTWMAAGHPGHSAAAIALAMPDPSMAVSAADMGGVMFAAHAVATLGTALLLAHSERALSGLASWLRPLVQLPQPSAAAPLRVPRPRAVNLVLPKARAGLRLPTRRGPPELSPAA